MRESDPEEMLIVLQSKREKIVLSVMIVSIALMVLVDSVFVSMYDGNLTTMSSNPLYIVFM